jgi:hypothetical protein
MSKVKSGLHKEVSAIFGGSQIQPRTMANQGGTSLAEPKSDAANSHSSGTLPAQKPDTVSQILTKATALSKHNQAKGKSTGFGKLVAQIKNKISPPGSKGNTKKQMMMAVMMPLLAIILVFVLIKSFGASPKKAAKAKKGINTEQVGSADLEQAWIIPAEYPTSMRDPMQMGKGGAAGAQSDVVVSGILFSSAKPTAVISGKVAKEGDVIFGAKVIKINSDSVVLMKDGKTWNQRVQRQ